ncbi:MAG: hypothetical protein Q9220_003782 [cf. Caloplaca sp. 1 TL-2023]
MAKNSDITGPVENLSEVEMISKVHDIETVAAALHTSTLDLSDYLINTPDDVGRGDETLIDQLLDKLGTMVVLLEEEEREVKWVEEAMGDGS